MKTPEPPQPSSISVVRETPPLNVRVYRSINEIEASLWDSVCAAFGLSATHRFIRALEDSQVADAQYWYLLVSSEEELVGAAVITGFRVSLDLLNPQLHKVTAFARKVWPRFLTLPILFCGTPISIGRHCLCSKCATWDAAVVDSVVDFMEQVAASENMTALCAKEFPAGDRHKFARLEQRGFFAAPSLPRIRLRLRWSNYADYLAEMRAGYRRQVVSSLRKAHWDRLQPEFGDSSRHQRQGLYLDVGRPSPEQAPFFAALYAQTMSRAESRLETLNEMFFSRLFDTCSADLDLLTLRNSGVVLGAALLNCHDRTLHFLLVGVDYSTRDEYDTYFNLLNGIVALAIARNCDHVDFGQTSYHVKGRLGGIPEDVIIYLKARSRSLHVLLRACRPLLFPTAGLQRLRVFREDVSIH